MTEKLSDNLINQYKGCPRLSEIIDNFQEISDKEISLPIAELEKQINVDTAEDFWLDLIGSRVGLPRLLLRNQPTQYFGFDNAGLSFYTTFAPPVSTRGVRIDNDLYRKLIVLKAKNLISDGTLGDASEILKSFSDTSEIYDYQNMTMGFRFGGSLLEQVRARDLAEFDLVPKPAGVEILLFQNVRNGVFFGFDDNGISFDQAPFAEHIYIAQRFSEPAIIQFRIDGLPMHSLAPVRLRGNSTFSWSSTSSENIVGNFRIFQGGVKISEAPNNTTSHQVAIDLMIDFGESETWKIEATSVTGKIISHDFTAQVEFANYVLFGLSSDFANVNRSRLAIFEISPSIRVNSQASRMGDYQILLVPTNRKLMSITDTVFEQDITDIFTERGNVTFNGQEFTIYSLGRLVDGVDETYVVKISS